MTEMLHTLSLVPMGIGVCSLAMSHRRCLGRALDLAISLVMIVAMVDSIATVLLPTPLWTAALLVSAMSYSATSTASARRHDAPERRMDPRMSTTTALATILMAALLPLTHARESISSISSHDHDGAALPLPTIAGISAIVFVALAVRWSVSAAPADRIHHLSMSASVVAMSAPLAL